MKSGIRVYGHALAGVAAVGLMAGCGTVNVPVRVLRPAEINMADYKQIAISKIGGNIGKPLSDALKERLVESGRFTVVDRSRTDLIMKELNLSHSDLAQSDKAAQLGNLLPATAIIVGDMNGKYVEQVTHEDTTCKRDKREYKCRVYTRTGTYTTTGSVDVIDVATGQILKSKSLANQYESSSEETDKLPERIDVQGLMGYSIGQSVDLFMKAITPWTEVVQAPFKTDGDIPALETGVNKAKIGDMRGAADTFQAAARDAEMNPKVDPKAIGKAYWNLGLASQYAGRFDKAAEAFQKACALDPNDACSSAISNLDRLRSEKRRLDDQNR